ncbi:MAG: hypothetical protein LKF87_12320 [Clostridium tyrobutyricum]|uniref:hypothetical protein n=1 Tax=Clostridium tyrobutyricum TaxID=1519 RepID=UPI002432024D|nr:hypothetical protein [Clostridium tyrobutyricum]MCH4200143.1 hypothetical protein [Clostridium tyrobutyricum]MCH4259711.1 hypothetical protein [Clostridium tyrobutyricum]
MKKYIFIGADRVGKSNLILSMAKVLAKLNKKVLVVDTTISQGIKSFFDFNFQIETKDPLRDLTPIVRENFKIIFTIVEDNYDFKRLEKVDFENYDYVFIEADKNFDKGFMEEASKIYLLQDYDKATLEKNKKILSKFKIKSDKLIIVFIKRLEICDNMYFLSELIPCLSNLSNNRNDDIEIDFSEEDYVNILESKLNGSICLSDFSDEYKSSLFNLVNNIIEITPRKYQRIVR